MDIFFFHGFSGQVYVCLMFERYNIEDNKYIKWNCVFISQLNISVKAFSSQFFALDSSVDDKCWMDSDNISLKFNSFHWKCIQTFQNAH